MNVYADTNFLTRCYLLSEDFPAPHHQLEELSRQSAWLPVTWLHRLEVANAFQLHVFASKSVGQTRITSEMAAAADARFRSDCNQPASFLRQAPISLSDIEPHFQEICLRHTAKHGFRTYDILHVTSALLLACDRFWSFDAKANKLAALEGLQTLLPKHS
jgi:predicted nucleic acid-binding protein